MAYKFCNTGLWIIHYVSNKARYKNIVFITLHLILAYIKSLMQLFLYITQHIFDMCRNWVNIYGLGILVLSFIKVQFQLIDTFLAFFVWSINFPSLICKLKMLFWTFSDMWTVVILQDISYCFLYKKCLPYIEKLISTVGHFLATFRWLINRMSWMSLNFVTFFRYMQKSKHCFCLRPFSNFIHGNFNYNYYIRFQLFPDL